MSDSVRNSGWNLSGDQYRWCGCKCAIEFVSFETLKTHVPTSHTLTTLHKINIQFNASRAVRVKVQIYYYFRCRNGCWRSRSRRLHSGGRTSLMNYFFSVVGRIGTKYWHFLKDIVELIAWVIAIVPNLIPLTRRRPWSAVEAFISNRFNLPFCSCQWLRQ